MYYTSLCVFQNGLVILYSESQGLSDKVLGLSGTTKGTFGRIVSVNAEEFAVGTFGTLGSIWEHCCGNSSAW